MQPALESPAGAPVKIPERPVSWSGLAFPLGLGLLSHLIAYLTVYLTATAGVRDAAHQRLHPVWNLLARWDGGWYERIALHGYEYAPDRLQHSVAFFPLYPLLVRPLAQLGVPFGLAGAIVNGLAFLGALVVLFVWARSLGGEPMARWATAALALCPMAVFGSVAYTEGLFLLLTLASLFAAWRGKLGLAACWGILATASRLPGIALIPALLLEAMRQRRGWSGLVAAAAPALGTVAYFAWLWRRFGDPLAFLHAEHAWQRSVGIDVAGFLHLLIYGMVSEGMLPAVLVFGGVYLAWRYRDRLPAIALAYTGASFAILFLAGNAGSAARYVYGIGPLALAAGWWLAERPRWAWAIVIYAAVLLSVLARNFALGQWVA